MPAICANTTTRRSIRSTRRNFNALEVAWRFKTDSLGPRPEYKLEGTPLMVNGVLYTTAGTRRSVVALDAATGELLLGARRARRRARAVAPRQLSGRGVAYWTDGEDERILYVTTGYRLVALDAKTGARIASFGKDGIVDLKDDVVFGKGQQIDLRDRRNRPALDAGGHQGRRRDDRLVVARGRHAEDAQQHQGAGAGFDVRTGKRLWTFNTIPRPGEFGNDTWENESWAVNGNVGVWNQIGVDEDLGLAYLPVETPTLGFLRRPSARQQPVRREPRRDRSARPASASGISSSCTIRSGTWTSRPAPMLVDSPSNGRADQGGGA